VELHDVLIVTRDANIHRTHSLSGTIISRKKLITIWDLPDLYTQKIS